MRRALLAIGIGIGAIVLAVLAIDLVMFPDDEVAILVTHDLEGHVHETPLWIVEIAGPGEPTGAFFVRAHSDGAQWLARLRAAPEVEIARDGEESVFVAEVVADDAVLRARVNAAMAEKYGAVNSIAGWLADPEDSVPVRLRPAAASGGRDS